MLREIQINWMGSSVQTHQAFCHNMEWTAPQMPTSWQLSHTLKTPVSFPLLSRQPKQLTACQGLQFSGMNPTSCVYSMEEDFQNWWVTDPCPPCPATNSREQSPSLFHLYGASLLSTFSQVLQDRSMLLRTAANHCITSWGTWGLTWGFITHLTHLL